MLQFITHTTDRLEDVLRGGCRWVQLRMKDATDEEVLAAGAEVHRLCRKYGATFIVDDRVGLVEPLDADGVHLGKNDMAPSEARKILGDKIIGATANTMEDVERALAEGADYLGIGPFRFTTTKKNLAPVLGLDGYRRIMSRKIPVPVVAIGGILLDDLRDIKTTGVTGVAVSGLILNSTNPEETTRQILNIWKN